MNCAHTKLEKELQASVSCPCCSLCPNCGLTLTAHVPDVMAGRAVWVCPLPRKEVAP